MKTKMMVNGDIKSPSVILIMPDGVSKGVVPLNEARNIARDEDLDLVQVSESEEKPICKLMDFTKWKYKQSKAKKPNHQVTKEIRVSFLISDYDLDRKLRQAKKFLSKGAIVRYSMELKGREQQKFENAFARFSASLENFQDVASFDKPNGNGRLISTLLKPQH
jgi:translation initiation factor IF-3